MNLAQIYKNKTDKGISYKKIFTIKYFWFIIKLQIRLCLNLKRQAERQERKIYEWI